MFIRHTILSIFIATLGWCIAGSSALAAYLAPMSGYTESDWNEKVTGGGFVEEFNISSYIGDGGGPFYELEVNDIESPDLVKSTQQKQFSFFTETRVDFSLTLEDGVLSYNVGGETLMVEDFKNNPNLDINGMMLMANSTDSSDVVLENLALDGMSTMESLASKSGDSDFLQITGIDKDFMLTGTQVYTWDDGNRPDNSALGYNIKVGKFQPVAQANIQQEIPEPSTISFFSLLAIGAGIKLSKK